MSHQEPGICRYKGSFRVEVSRQCRCVSRQFNVRVYGEQEALIQARNFRDWLRGLPIGEFLKLKLLPPPLGLSPPGRPAAMRYIRRLRRGESKGGWMVMLRPTRTFSDAKFGGEADALAAAMRYRDACVHDRGEHDLLSPRQDSGPRTSVEGLAGPVHGPENQRGAGPAGG